MKLNSEHELCKSFVNQVKYLLRFRKLPPLILLHIPNERKLTAKDYAYYNSLKAIGLVAGAPDYVIYNGKTVINIEFKHGKNIQSDNQKRFECWSKICDVPYYLCYDTKSAVDLVIKHFPAPKLTQHVDADGQFYLDL